MAQVENWKGTMLSFILHYQEQIWLYDQLQPPNEQTSDHAKMIYLQNAVYAIEELRSVQTTGSQLALANGTVPMYKDYEAFLKSVTIELMHPQSVNRQGLPNARIFGMPMSPNLFTKHMNLDLILTLLLTLCKHICVTSRG
jgi:hypothetical protein